MIPHKRYSACVLAAALLIASCNDKPSTGTSNTPAPAAVETNVPSVLGYSIVNQFPHDPKAFTEGLEYRDGFLYEGTGQYGKSEVRKVELTTGKVLQSVKMEARFFGEGITM